MGGPPFSYGEYLTSVKSVATQFDEQRTGKSTRDINMMMYDDESEEAALIEYAINEVKRQWRNPEQLAAQMNKDTWTSLSSDTQTIWDTIPKEDKAKILSYADKRGERRKEKDATRTTRVNNHEIAPPEEPSTDDVPDTPSDELPSINVNNVLSKARREAHPGDPRRVLGSNKKSYLEAMVHRVGQYDDDSSSDESDDFHSYWGDQDFHQGDR